MNEVNGIANRITGIISFLGIATFCVFLLLPTLDNLFQIDNSPKIEEQRFLKSAPSIPDSWNEVIEFPTVFEGYFNDNFGFRKSLLRLNNYLHVAFLATSPASKVILGKNNWLFFVPQALDNYRRLPAKSPVKAWREMLHKRQVLLEKNGIEFLFVCAPDKHSIYPEYMPDKYNHLRDKSFLDELIEELKESTNVNILDLRPPLIKGKNIQQVYDRTGTHWNQYGAFIASKSILDHLSVRFPTIKSAYPIRSPFDAHTKINNRKGAELAMIMGLEHTEMYSELPRVGYHGEQNFTESTKHIQSITKGRKNFQTISRNKSLPRGVIFRDSFGTTLIPYLSEGFSELTYLWQNNFDSSFVLKIKPDIVIEEIAERKLILDVNEIRDLDDPQFKLKNAKVNEKFKNAVRETEITINRESRKVIFATPPSAITYSNIKIPKDAKLSFGIALAKKSWEHEGDGVTFLIKIRKAGEDGFLTVFSIHLDPYHEPKARQWIDLETDLSMYGGEMADLMFVTMQGKDSNNDYPLWNRISLY